MREECKKDKSSNIVSVYDFWDNKESLFPNLIFCENVKEHIYKNPEPRHIRAIIKRLEILNKYYIEHDIFDIKTLGFNARTESDSVKNNTKLKQLRNFKKPDGSYSYFYNHISFTGSFPGRIHFLEDNNLKKIYIGYIGVHLSTAKY